MAWPTDRISGLTRTILFLIAVFVSPARAYEALRCDGVFGPNSSRNAIVASFGLREVVTQKIFQGGDTMNVTVVFPKNPTRRIMIEWRDPSKSRGIKRILINGNSLWSIGGVPIGMPIADVQKINGKPFKIAYFEGDIGGAVLDWQGGALEKLPGGCGLGATFAIDEKATASDALDREVSRDRTLLSDGPALRKAAPIVSEL